MKHTTRLLLALAVSVTTISPVPNLSHAGDRESARPGTLQQAAATGPTQESRWGMGARVGCRLGIRRGHYSLATYGFCLMALVDALT